MRGRRISKSKRPINTCANGGNMAHPYRLVAAFLLIFLFQARSGSAAEKFYISIPGPTLSYLPLYYGQEKGFFAQEGLDLQVLVVRGIVGVSSLMSGEIDVTCHAGSGFSAACAACQSKSFRSRAIARSTNWWSARRTSSRRT